MNWKWFRKKRCGRSHAEIVMACPAVAERLKLRFNKAAEEKNTEKINKYHAKIMKVRDIQLYHKSRAER